MKSKSYYAIVAAAFALSTPSWGQEGKTAQQTGMAIAKKRGYANPNCYAEVFASYASQNSKGRWRAPTGKAAIGYKNEQHAKCGISI